jgi:transcriptional regulator with XRE-family HTH domain
MSQEHLALESGIDRAYVGGVERGERNASLTNIFKLADALGVSPSEVHARADKITQRTD